MDYINKIAPNFHKYEFMCNCGCGESRVNTDFLKRLQAARTIAGVAFSVNRGASCPDYNQELGGVKDSAHVPDVMPDKKCHAVDIHCPGSRDRWIMINALLKAGFTRIGIMKTALHVDDGERIGAKDKDVIFHYY